MYPNQPRQQDGWPAQPAQYTERPSVQPGHLPRRRRRRGWIVALGLLALLVALFVIADHIAKTYAENAIASKLQSSSGLSTKPSVAIEGFPFLTQVAARDIRAIDLSASDIQTGKLDISSVKAKATGVHLNSSFNNATIDQITGTALISFDALANATGAQGVTITADPAGGPNAAKVSVGPLTATARIVQTGSSQITVRVESLNGFAASSFPDYTIQVPKLPAGLQVRGVSVTDQGITVDVSAQNTSLSQ